MKSAERLIVFGVALILSGLLLTKGDALACPVLLFATALFLYPGSHLQQTLRDIRRRDG